MIEPSHPDMTSDREPPRDALDAGLAVAFGQEGKPAVTLEERPAREGPGTVIGPYKLLQQIGEGGMGTVWMAQQQEPVKRVVALKLIKAGMDSKQVIARFEAERQALAMMDHVNIARVFDGGTCGAGVPPASDLDAGETPAPQGRPYFVMELVHGVPITKYCDDNHLTPRERLELFVPVCQAIQHAHQKGIIHRDIKPSNVMVTLYDGKPMPKVIDFGVAKATEQKLTERTLFTQYGAMVGTLEYMSPEQAEMSALGVDTRSDIYSLGVLLYELLTGNTPLTHMRMKEAAYAEILRMIKEVEPPKPSTRLSDSGEALASISANRHMEPAKLTKLVRGELDWIVMKTLEKDRNRRYETAKDFAADVQRYLNDEQVQACPPSAGYRLRKFARRNKGGLAVAALVLFFLMLLGSGVGWAVRDREARQRRIETQVDLILGEVEQHERQQKWPEALAVVQRAEALAAGGADAATQERVRQVLHALQMVAGLEELRLHETRGVEPGAKIDEGRPRLYAAAFRDFGVDVETLPAEESAARLRARPAVAIPLAAVLDDWARAGRLKNHDQSKRLWALAAAVDPDPWRVSVRQASAAGDVDSLMKLANAPDTARQQPQSLILLASSLRLSGKPEQALALLERACVIHPADVWIHFDLASYNYNLRPARLEAAVRHGIAARALRPRSAGTWLNLGASLLGQNKLNEAIACYHKVIELDPKYVMAHYNLGNALYAQNKLDEAIASYKKAIELAPNNAMVHNNLGNVLRAQRKLDEAIACYEKAIELDPTYAAPHYGVGSARYRQRKLDEAIAAYRKAIELDPKDVNAHVNLGRALSEQNKLDEAIAAFRKLIEVEPKFAEVHIMLGRILEQQKKPDEAIAVYRQGLKRLPDEARLHAQLAHVLWKQSRLEEATASFRQAIKLLPTGDNSQYYSLGCVLNEQKKPKEAVDALRKAIDLNPKFARAHYQLGLALSALVQDADAILCYRKAIELDAKYAQAYISLGNALRTQGKLEDAIAAFRQAIALEKKMPAASPRPTPSQLTLAVLLNDRAWQLVTGDDPKSRDPKRALELAQEAGALAPNWPNWKTLGVAHYRAGNWKTSVEALEKFRQLNPAYSKDSVILFFLSMAHGRLNEKELALTFYDQAAQWRMGIGSTEQELRRLCAEAAAQLGVEVPPTLRESPGPTLLKPAAGATLDNGTLNVSKLRVWEFDWSDVPGATQYHLYMTGPIATLWVINNPTLTSPSYRYEAKGYFPDQVRLGWRWKVRALVKGTWTDWSEERTFAVAPLSDNKPASHKK